MSARLSLRLQATLDSLQELEQTVGNLARSEAWTSSLEYQIKLVLDELSSNIINYGYGDGDSGEIEIELTSGPETITIDITDDGQPFDPLTEGPPPDTESALEDRPLGGLGIHLVRTLVDKADYQREGGKNRMTLVKRRQE